MKILVFSDSHRALFGMYEAIEAEQPDQVIHLGDLMSDAEEVAHAYPLLPFALVPGNCDGFSLEPPEKCLSFAGKTILFSHGHIWRVKSGYDAALARARQKNADVVLFGHTHRAYCVYQDGLWVLNPGPARAGYGIVEIVGEAVSCRLVTPD